MKDDKKSNLPDEDPHSIDGACFPIAAQSKPVKLPKDKQWHERETPINIKGTLVEKGIKIVVTGYEHGAKDFEFLYPENIWKNYSSRNRKRLLDNVVYVFTAHLPFLFKGILRLEYNTGYPQVFSWANQCFMRHLPAYWFLYNRRRGTRPFPLLRTLLNTRSVFSRRTETVSNFTSTKSENIVIPFTFGKDSFLTYHVAKEIGLNTVLIYFNEFLEHDYEGKHKKKLFDDFIHGNGDEIYFLDNPFGLLREQGDGWFGWEMAITSWSLLALPLAHYHRSRFIVFSNEMMVNAFLYDDSGLKVIPDYEQTAQATEEISLLTQALSNSRVYTTTFLQGLHDLGIIGILKDRYFKKTFRYLMSCWAENEFAKDKRWCANCSKCARLYIYLVALGIDPMKDTGFKDNMLVSEKEHLYNVFGKTASGTGWDAFGLNTEEQSLAFYLAYLRGNRDPLVKKFTKTHNFKEIDHKYEELIEEYFSLHREEITPVKWKKRVDILFVESLDRIRKEMVNLKV